MYGLKPKRINGLQKTNITKNINTGSLEAVVKLNNFEE
jgi:hypothetical protein